MVAAFNIISGLIMLVKDKGREIGILRTMGASKGAIMRVFLITGASIGVVGTLAGCAARRRSSAGSIDEIRQFVAWLTSTKLFDPEIYYLTQAAGRHQRAHDRRHRRHGAGAVGAGDALSLLARLAPRSRRSAALRVSVRESRPVQDATARPVLQLRGCSAARSARATGRSPCSRAPRPISIRARRWRWSARRVRASRRCCTSPACSRRPTAGGSSSTARDCSRLSDAERTRVRRSEMGFVYQFHQLLPEFSALENVLMPQMIRGATASRRRGAGAASC